MIRAWRPWWRLLPAALALAPTGAGSRAAEPLPASEATAPVDVADSVAPFLRRVERALDRRDLRLVMATYADTGLVISSAFGHMTESRTAIRADLERFFLGTVALQFNFATPRVHLLAPDAAALAARYTASVTPRDAPPYTAHGVWTGVVAVRGGRLVILQEHQSQVSSDETAS